MSKRPFIDAWRRQKSKVFDLYENSTAKKTVVFSLWGKPLRVYANANLSIYSAQSCNARCAFCVEELRPASRGTSLACQKIIERDDERYFAAMEYVLASLRPLSPSVSLTGGEASKDPRLPEILRLLQRHGARKRTMTTNGSGLLDERGGMQVVDWLIKTGVRHLNISRAHTDCARNAALMSLHEGLNMDGLRESVARAKEGGVRPRLSCVLLKGEIDSMDGIFSYLEFAERAGVDNVIFRQLMQTDAETSAMNFVIKYCDSMRVSLEPILNEISGDARFTFQRQIIGYYYYVEVWKYKGMDVVFEEADLAQLEVVKRAMPGVIHELVFHPSACLASTWQPWDGVLGPDAEDEVCLKKTAALVC